MGNGAVGMRSRLFLKKFPSESRSEEKARRRKWAEITDHPPKPHTALQVIFEQDSAHDVDAAVGGRRVCQRARPSAHSRSACRTWGSEWNSGWSSWVPLGNF